MRKHVKTVHGPEFYASKRHKGTNSSGFDSSPRSDGQSGGNSNRFDSSPKNTSVSSPSIKSESDTNSPDQSPIDGISGREHKINVKSNAAGFNDDYEYVPSMHMDSLVNRSNDCYQSTPMIGETISAMDDPAWPYEDENLEVADLPFVLREMVGLGSGMDNGYGDGVVAIAPSIDRMSRHRFKPRLQIKGMSHLSNIPEIHRHTSRPAEINTKRFTDLKTEIGMGIDHLHRDDALGQMVSFKHMIPNVSIFRTIFFPFV